MSEVTRRTYSDVRTTEEHEVGRIMRDLGEDYFYVGTVEKLTRHVVTENEVFSGIELPEPQHVIIHVPERRDYSPPFGHGLDFLEPV